MCGYENQDFVPVLDSCMFFNICKRVKFRCVCFMFYIDRYSYIVNFSDRSIPARLRVVPRENGIITIHVNGIMLNVTVYEQPAGSVKGYPELTQSNKILGAYSRRQLSKRYNSVISSLSNTEIIFKYIFTP